jgi:hypothetical protein
MRDPRKRLERLEAQRLRAMVSPIAAEYGVDPDELIDETRRFFALTDAQQDAEFAAAIAQATARGDAEHVRLLTEGWQALKSYR